MIPPGIKKSNNDFLNEDIGLTHRLISDQSSENRTKLPGQFTGTQSKNR
jgi:hypothetical protein